MKAVADYVHAKGLKFGMYSCCGTHTCAGYPGSFEHEFDDAEQFAAWGVDYLKYDNCYKPQHVDGEILYKRMSLALRNSGRDIVLSALQLGPRGCAQLDPRLRRAAVPLDRRHSGQLAVRQEPVPLAARQNRVFRPVLPQRHRYARGRHARLEQQRVHRRAGRLHRHRVPHALRALGDHGLAADDRLRRAQHVCGDARNARQRGPDPHQPGYRVPRARTASASGTTRRTSWRSSSRFRTARSRSAS